MPGPALIYIKRYNPTPEELYRYESESDKSNTSEEEWVSYVSASTNHIEVVQTIKVKSDHNIWVM